MDSRNQDTERLARLLELASEDTQKRVRRYFFEQHGIELKRSVKKDLVEHIMQLALSRGCATRVIGEILGKETEEIIPRQEWNFSAISGASVTALRHRHFEKAQQMVLKTYRPQHNSIALFTLCTHTKPYRFSKTVSCLWKALEEGNLIREISIFFLSSPGVVPYGLDILYPFAYYEWPIKNETQAVKRHYTDVIYQRVFRFLLNFGKNFRYIVAYFRPSSESLMALRNACRHLNLPLIQIPDRISVEEIKAKNRIRWSYQGLRSRECLNDLVCKLSELWSGKIKSTEIRRQSVRFPDLATRVVWRYRRASRKWPRPSDRPILAYSSKEYSVLSSRPVEVGNLVLNTIHCPKSCVMCGFWRDTVNDRPEKEEFKSQLDYFDAKVRGVSEIKIFSSGSFFDQKAIPDSLKIEITNRYHDRALVSVEARISDDISSIISFGKQVNALEVSFGLEVADDEALYYLNKQNDLSQFPEKVRILHQNHILVKCYILVGIPFFTTKKAVHLSKRTVDYCEDLGVDTVSIMPTVIMPGVMERLAAWGFYRVPHPARVMEVVRYAKRKSIRRLLVSSISYNPKFGSYSCSRCVNEYRKSFKYFNLHQQYPKTIECECKQEEYENFLSPNEQLLICMQKALPARKKIIHSKSMADKRAMVSQLVLDSLSELCLVQ